MASPLRTAAPYGPSAHRLGDSAGRSPGSRVSACRPAFPVSQWLTRTTGSPLTVAGAATASATGSFQWTGPVFPLASPALTEEPARRQAFASVGGPSRERDADRRAPVA